MILISSFYNEQYMLPWWLEHHKKIFSHAVLFDYHSTDSSVEIIKSRCPDWEVRESKYKFWDPRTNDEEMMEAEREFDREGEYKMTLTTTEFLVGDLPEFSEEPTCYSIPFYRIIDDKPWDRPVYQKPLVEQKYKEFKEPGDRGRRRFLHNYPDGQYGIGRHKTKLPNKDIDMRIFKYVYAPWTEEFKKRRVAMGDLMSKEHKNNKSWGLQHKMTYKELEDNYRKVLENV